MSEKPQIIRDMEKRFREISEGEISVHFTCTPKQAIELIEFFEKIKKL